MDDMALPDSDAFFFPEREKSFPVFDELPYGPEAWPGKVISDQNHRLKVEFVNVVVI